MKTLSLVFVGVCMSLLDIAELQAQKQPLPRPAQREPTRAAVPEGVKKLADLEYAKVGEKQLKLDLYLPENAAGPLPIIVGIHGGGWASGSKDQAQGIRQASRGYAVATIGYRLSGEAIFPAQIIDCKAAVRWLRANAKKYNLDPERIAVTGHSAGGHLASLLGTSTDVKEFDSGENLDQSSRVNAVCALSGPTDLLQMDAHAIAGARLKHDTANSPESRLIGGAIQENKDKVARANPITYVSKTSPPFLLIHGDQDPVVPPHQAELLHAALQKAGVEVQLQLVKGAAHGVGGREVNELVDAFFDKHLKSAAKAQPAPAAEKPAQPPAQKSAPPKAAGDVRQPVGLFVCRGPNPTPEREVDFDFIDGWLVRPAWNKVEPAEGEFDWKYIDNEIALAKKLKKKITLCVLGGPQTPAWVYKAGALEFAYKMPIGPRGEVRIPLLWDETYQKKWTALINALGQRYANEETIVLVHITGATGNGLEMQLPFLPDDRRNWDRAGYTAEKAIAGWQKIIDAFGAAFPNKPLDLDIHPVLGSDQVATAVAAYGSEKLGKRFGIFGGWISGKDVQADRHHAGMHALAKKYGNAGFSAWQMIASASKTPQQFAEGGLTAAVEQGMTWNARYFEIWETDAMKPELEVELKAISAKLKR